MVFSNGRKLGSGHQSKSELGSWLAKNPVNKVGSGNQRTRDSRGKIAVPAVATGGFSTDSLVDREAKEGGGGMGYDAQNPVNTGRKWRRPGEG